MSSLSDGSFDSLHPDVRVWTGMKAAERDRAIRRLDAELGRLTVAKAALIAECDRTQVYAEDCFRSVNQWVRAVGNTSRGTSTYLVQQAKLFALLPKVADAYARGMVGADQVRLLVGLWANPRCRSQLAGFEDFLLGAARTFVLHEFKEVCIAWELGADPDGSFKEHEAARASRGARYETIGAWFRLVMEGDNISGEMMKEVLDAHTHAEYLADLAARDLEYGPDASGKPLRRTGLQRMFDAVKVIFMKAAATTDTTDREPLVALFTTPQDLEDAIRDYFAAGCQATGDLGDPTESLRMRLCQTKSGAPVSTRDLAIAAIHGWVQRVVVDPKGHVINLGRRSRLFRGPSRDAVLFTGDRCNGPGCHVRHDGIQIDHLKPWQQFGRTDQDNAGPDCGWCNRIKHIGHFDVTRDEHGWHWYRPDGTEITPRGDDPND